MGGGLTQPIPGIGPLGGRVMAGIATGGLSEALPSQQRDALGHGFGQVFFSPASGLAAGGAGLLGGGSIGGGGFGAAASPGAAGGGAGAGLEGLTQFAIPGAPAQTLVPTGAGSVLPASGVGGLADIGGGLTSGAALNTGAGAGTAAGASGTNMLQNAFLATSVGGMLGNAFRPPPPPTSSPPGLSVGGGGGFTPVATSASQQWAQLMAQRRAQQTGKFTV